MSIVESKQKLFTYWRVRFQIEPFGQTLETLLKAGFDKTKIKDRRRSPSENYYQYINFKTHRNGFFCAGFLAHEKNSTGRTVAQRPERDAVEIEAIAPGKAADGAPREYLDGNLYFVCKNNHLIVAQDLHLKAKHLEEYLNEILHTLPSGLPETQCVILERAIPRETRKKAEKGFSEVKISAPLEYRKKAPIVIGDKVETRSVPMGRVWNVIQSFLPDSVKKDLSTDGITDPKQIDVSVELKWKRKRPRKERQSDQMDMLANTFRHVDEVKIEARTTDGVVIKNNELRMQKLTSVRHRDNLPLKDNIFEKMINWFHILNNQGSV
jgi:hypothetical protein